MRSGIAALVGLRVHMDGETNQPNHLDTALFKLILELCKGTEFGGAYGREVGRVGEEYRPAALDELVEVNVAMCGFGLEVGRCS